MRDPGDNWQQIGTVTSRMLERLKPETFSVPLQAPLAAALRAEATKAGTKPETIIAEALRAYMGDAA